MRNNRYKASGQIFIYMLALIALLTAGCGKGTKELDEYYDSMNAFTAEVMDIKAGMEDIDTGSEEAASQILAYLDELEEQFRILSEIEVPDDFKSNEELADEAYEYMQKAVESFHDYYDDPESDYSSFEYGHENYERAMKRVGYISYVLKGELPEGADYDVIEEDNTDFEPVTEDNAY